MTLESKNFERERTTGSVEHVDNLDATREIATRYTPLRLIFFTGREHKVNALIHSMSAVSHPEQFTVIQEKTGDMPEPPYIASDKLIREKAENFVAAVKARGAIWKDQDIFVIQDVNIGLGVAGEEYVPLRKPDYTEKMIVADIIVDTFKLFPTDGVATVKIDAATAYYISKYDKWLILMQRANIQISPIMLSALQNKNFVNAYVAYAQRRYKKQKDDDINTGATNKRSPAGIRWDDLYRFVKDHGTRWGLTVEDDCILHIESESGETNVDTLEKLVRGYTMEFGRQSAKLLRTNWTRLENSQGKTSVNQPIMMHPPRPAITEKWGK